MAVTTGGSGGIFIKCNVVSRSTFFRYFHDCYSSGLCCDVALHCRDGTSIPCHSLVLSAASRTLYAALRASNCAEDEARYDVHLPDYAPGEVKEFVDNVYAYLAGDVDKEGFFKAKESNEVYEIFSDESLASLLDTKEALNMQLEPDISFPDDPLDFEGGGGPYGSQEEGESLLSKTLKGGSRKRKAGDQVKTTVRNFKPTGFGFKGKKEEASAVSIKQENIGCGEEDDNEDPFGDFEIKKKRDRSWQPKTLEELVEEDEGEDHGYCAVNREELHALMKVGILSVKVNLLAKPLNIALHCNKYNRMASGFQALVGIASYADGIFVARPLAWSIPTVEDISTQFDSCQAAFKSVFGFSDADVCYNGLLYSRQGHYKKNRSKKVRYELRRKYANFSKEQLENLVSTNMVQNAMRRGPMKPNFSVPTDTQCELNFSPDLGFESLSAIALLSWDRNTCEVTGRIMRLEQDKMEDEANKCLKCLFDVWCVGRPLRIPESVYLGQKFNEMMEPMETYRIVQEYHNEDPDGTHRESLLKKEKQCPDCGMVFPAVTVADEFKYTTHRRNHFFENFTCECNIELKTIPQKRNHFRLVHSDGRYIKCDQCAYVGTENSVKSHRERDHSKPKAPPGPPPPSICDVCGKVLNDAKALYMHMMTHKVYKCNECPFEVVGYSAIQTHKKNAHPVPPELFPCEVCGKIFTSRLKLKTHHLRMHVEDKDRPYQCEDCGRGFAVSRALGAHRMMAHIKSRPYACRYGCGAAYNDHASRGTHEKKKHGGRFPVETMKPII